MVKNGSERTLERGFTILEALVAFVVITFMSVLIIQAMRSLTSTQAFSEGQSTTTTMAERAVERMVRDVQFALRVYPEDAASRGLLDVMDLRNLAPFPGSRLPVASTLGYFEPDPPAQVETGNLLFLARSQPPQIVTLPSRPGDPLRVDLMRFVLYCLSQGGGSVVDLNRWSSVVVARHQDLASIEPATDRLQAGIELRAAGIEYTWDTEQPAASAFYLIGTDGSLEPMAAPFLIPGDPAQTELAILSTRHSQVAPNDSLRSVAVPAYAIPAPGFPNGFEVKVDQSGSGSLVLMRLVVTTILRSDRLPNFAEVMRLMSVRES